MLCTVTVRRRRIFSVKVRRRRALTRSRRECVGWRHHVTSTCCSQDVMTSQSCRWRQQDGVLTTLTTINNAVIITSTSSSSSSSRRAHSTSVTLASFWHTSLVTLNPTSTSTLRALLVDQVVSTRNATARLLRRFISVFQRILLCGLLGTFMVDLHNI